jgi:Protein of unknown function (DUF4239)
MGTWFYSIFVVAGSVLASIGGLLLVRKIISADILRQHHELAGNILAVVGTLNAVLLGLVILEAQSRFQQARTNEAAESSAIADIRLYAEYLPEPTRSAVDRHVSKYVTLVREKEWDLPPAEQPNKEAVHEFHCLWNLVCAFKPATAKEQNLQTSMLASLTQSFDLRRFRVTSGRHGLPQILWAVLIICSVTTVVFTYFFAGEKIWVQALMVALLSITLAMGILVVSILGNPYVGDWKIRPEQFTRITTTGLPISSDSDPFEPETSPKTQSVK